MRIIGLDGKEYQSEKECLIADKKYQAAINAQKEKEEKEKRELEERLSKEKAALSARKKELAKAVEDSSEKLDQARKLYQTAKKRAQEILSNARKEADDIIGVAAKELDKASYDRMDAISKFNKEFGAYKTVITGNDAIDEHNILVNSVESFLRSLVGF